MPALFYCGGKNIPQVAQCGHTPATHIAPSLYHKNNNKMKTTSTSNWQLNSSLVAAFLLIFNLFSVATLSQKKTAKNIVLVHGAFVDCSVLKKVHDILVKKG